MSTISGLKALRKVSKVAKGTPARKTMTAANNLMKAKGYNPYDTYGEMEKVAKVFAKGDQTGRYRQNSLAWKVARETAEAGRRSKAMAIGYGIAAVGQVGYSHQKQKRKK